MRAAIEGLALALACLACRQEDVNETADATDGVEVVMSEGMRVTWEVPSGEMSVLAGPGFERTYSWDGVSRVAVLWPRQRRWYGSLGLYFPGPGEHWKDHKGVRRGVLEEGQQHFDSVEEALDWLNARKWGNRLWTSSGLVVEWAFVPDRRELNVGVWQILVDGATPTGMDGSTDDAIRIPYP